MEKYNIPIIITFFVRHESLLKIYQVLEKLKPKTLNDRIPIRRIPMKTPKKGFAGLH
jgi:hypothetical protein